MIYYVKPMHKQVAFSNIEYDDRDFKVTNELCDTGLSLPMHPYLSKANIEKISNYISEIVR